jgi:hypothetical protein
MLLTGPRTQIRVGVVDTFLLVEAPYLEKPEWKYFGGNIAVVRSPTRMNFLAGRFFGSSGILRRAHLVVLASNGPGLDPVLRLLVVAFPVRVVARKVRCLLQIVKRSVLTRASRSTKVR